MQVWLDIVRVTTVAFALPCYAGFGLALWLTPAQWRSLQYLLIPFLGLSLVDALAHFTSYAGFAGIYSFWIMMAVATILNLTASYWRRSVIRRPNRLETCLLLSALPALLLSLAPIATAEQLVPIGDSNGDPISHTTTTEFFKLHGLHDRVPVSIEHPAYVPVQGKIERNIRLGFHYFQLSVDILSGQQAHATFSIVSGVAFYLWALATGILAIATLRLSQQAGILTTIVFSVSALPLWISYGGYGPQVLGMGLLLVSFGSWVLALEARAPRSIIVAVATSSGLAGIYSDALPYLVAPIAIFATLRYLTKQANLAQLLGPTILGSLLALAINPVGWVRALVRVVMVTERVTEQTAGNVDWMLDLRQVAGFVPFKSRVTAWFGDEVTQLLWLAVIAAGALMFYGFLKLPKRSRLIALSFLLPHLASIFWFALGPKPYGYFKGWSMGWYMYVILGVFGLLALFHLARGRTMLRASILALAGMMFLWLAYASITLARDMTHRFAITPGMLEVIDWLQDVDQERTLYVSANELNNVSTFWLSYLLRDRPTRFSQKVIYTNFKGVPYRGQDLVVQHIESPIVWDTNLWQTVPRQQNEEFALVQLVPHGGRQFKPLPMQYSLEATLGDQIRLRGFDLNATSLEQDGQLEVTVTLYWQALTSMSEGYKVFVHLLDEQGTPVAQYDGHPRNWTYFTYFWQPGEIVVDSYKLALDASVPPGRYRLVAGMYLESTGQRLAAHQDGRPVPDSSITLGEQPVEIMPATVQRSDER